MAASNLLKVLRYVLNYAIDIKLIDHNPALGVKGYSTEGRDGHHTWEETEVIRFAEYYRIGSRPRLALALLLYTATCSAYVRSKPASR